LDLTFEEDPQEVSRFALAEQLVAALERRLHSGG
jgi:hypothetical protein